MNRSRKSWMLALGFGLAFSPWLALGREAEYKSHVPLPPSPTGDKRDPEQLFKDRLRQAEVLDKFRDKARKQFGKDVEDVLKQLKAAGIDPNDKDFARKMQDLAKRIAPDGEQPKLTPEEIAAAKRIFEDLFPKVTPKIDPNIDPKGDPKIGPKIDPNIEPKADPDPLPNAIPPRPEPHSLPPNPDQEAIRLQTYKQFGEWAKGLERFSGTLNDSPTLRDTAREWGRLALNAQGKFGDTSGPGIDARLAEWGQMAQQSGRWWERNWGSLNRLDLPRFSTLDLPTVGASVNFSTPRVPSGIGTGDVSRFVYALLWAGVAGLAFVFVWRLTKGRFPWPAALVKNGWRLGPWPVAPEAVSSREDLVRAFEYLSLLRFGRRANSWHHRDVAAHLGEQDISHRRAADELASAYERARYAPEREPLDADVLAAARRDLRLLAGVAAS